MERTQVGEGAPGRPPGRAGAAFAAIAVRLRHVVVPSWAAAVVAATLLLPGLGSAEPLALGGLVPDDAEAIETAVRASELFGAPLTADTAVVQRDPEGLSSEAQAGVLEQALAVSRRRDEGAEILLALPVVNTLELFPGAQEEGTTAVTFLFFADGTSLSRKVELAGAYARELGRPPGGVVGVTGPAPARFQQFEEIQRSLPLVEGATVALIALIMGLSFRSLGAPLLALLVAAVSFLLAVRLVPWVGQGLGVTVPHEVEPLLVALTLGIGTDYCVFFLAGGRRRLAAGESRLDAARSASAAVVPIVATAGFIVVAGTAALLVGELDFFRAFGPALALTAAITLVVSLTLVPACLALAGRHLFWPGLRPTRADGPPPAWREAAARFAVSRPVAVLVVLVCGGVLAGAASGLADTALGLRLIRGLPAGSEEREATAAAAHGFAQGILAPTVLLLERDGIAADGEALARLGDALRELEGVAAVLGPDAGVGDLDADVFLAPGGNAARYALVLEDDPLSAPAIADLRRLGERLPELLDAAGLAGAEAGVSGQTALAADTVEAVAGSSTRVGAVVLAVNFVLLALFLRALVAPLYLLATSVLSVAAAYGLATFFFQGLFDHSDLTYYVPFAAGVLLVSLGSDYNVYVVGRIWQEARERPLREAIATAAPRASRAISIAGLTLAASFAMLALIPVDGLREFAFLMAVGTLLEAFFVRSLLIPALLSLFGRVSAWPGSLAAPRGNR